MARFRKKPIEVEAEQFWPDKKPWPRGVEKRWPKPWVKGYWIETLEGWYEVSPGNWIITGIKGEKYPCGDDVFRATYEPIDEDGMIKND